MTTRRTLLGSSLALLGAAAGASLPRRGRAQTAAAPRRARLHNLHTAESLDTVYWADGAYIPDAMAEIDHVLRDFRTDQSFAIRPELIDLLHRLSARLETGQPFQIISGYRSPATNAMLHARSSGVASNSFHMRGMAMDIRLESVDLKHLHAAALDLGAGGVGVYPKSNFVHVDVGPVRRWQGV